MWPFHSFQACEHLSCMVVDMCCGGFVAWWGKRATTRLMKRRYNANLSERQGEKSIDKGQNEMSVWHVCFVVCSYCHRAESNTKIWQSSGLASFSVFVAKRRQSARRMAIKCTFCVFAKTKILYLKMKRRRRAVIPPGPTRINSDVNFIVDTVMANGRTLGVCKEVYICVYN